MHDGAETHRNAKRFKHVKMQRQASRYDTWHDRAVVPAMLAKPGPGNSVFAACCDIVQRTGQLRGSRIVQRMADPFFNRHRGKIKWTDACQTCHVHTDLRGIRASSMVRIDAAARAKIVLCCHGVELIARKPVAA